MSFLDVYIGQVKPPARSRETEIGAGPPKRDSPFFPPSHRSPYAELKRRIAAGEYDGEQVDWGAWVARVSKAQLQAFIGEMYDDDPTYRPGTSFPHLVPQLVELRDYVDRLNDGEYALVASEL